MKRHNQIYHNFVDKEIQVYFTCGLADQCVVVAEVRERLAVSNRASESFMWRGNIAIS
jgi:hypothetical protein